MSYKPINQAHAIAEAIVYFQFYPEFSDDLIRSIVEAHDTIQDLPVKSPMTRFVTQIEAREGQEHTFSTQAPQIVGRESKKYSPDRSLDWMLRSTENTVTCHCLSYGRWREFYSTARAYTNALFDKMTSDDPFVTSVGLTVVDKFVYEGEFESYSQKGLFREDNPYIVTRVKGAGSRWHCHSGWFEESEFADFETLHQLNIDAAVTKTEKGLSHVSTIVHNSVAKGRDGAAQGDQFRLSKLYGGHDDTLSSIIESLHKGNKLMMDKLLCEDMKKRINLRVESK